MRPVEYESAAWNELRAAPIAPQRIPYRASFRHDNGPASPRTSGNAASWGSRTSSSTSSLVTDARKDILWWITGAENPGESVGTTKPRMPSSVCAQTTATSATEPLVIHIFEPSSTQSASGPAPSRRALVRIDPGSDPWSASVRPKQPIASPAAILGSHACFCSSVPCRQMPNIASDPCTLTSDRIPESLASSSRQARP